MEPDQCPLGKLLQVLGTLSILPAPPPSKRRFSFAKFKEKFLYTVFHAAKYVIKQHLLNLNHITFKQYLGNNEILVQISVKTIRGIRPAFPLIVLGSDMSLTPAILRSGCWEPHLTSLFNEKTQPGMTALDIGANMGYYSALFASKGAYVHAFEPNPVLQEVLRKNIYMNSKVLQTSKCTVNQCVVGNRQDTIDMKFPSWITGDASIKADISSYKKFLDLHHQSAKVSQIKLDEYVKLNNLEKIDIIKIDVEGYEEEALRGATELLTQAQDLMLCMEYTRNRYSDNFPSWLFNLFPRAYLPRYRRSINVQFLEAYEKEEIFSSVQIDPYFLDIVFMKGRHFP